MRYHHASCQQPQKTAQSAAGRGDGEDGELVVEIVGAEDREQGPTVEAEQGAVGEHSLVIRGQQAHVRPPLRPARHQPLQLQSGLGLAMFYVEICLMMVLGCSR